MNKQRRKRIAAAVAAIDALMVEINAIRNEECDAFDSMPESLKQSDRGQGSEGACTALDDAYGLIEDGQGFLLGIAQFC